MEHHVRRHVGSDTVPTQVLYNNGFPSASVLRPCHICWWLGLSDLLPSLWPKQITHSEQLESENLMKVLDDIWTFLPCLRSNSIRCIAAHSKTPPFPPTCSLQCISHTVRTCPDLKARFPWSKVESSSFAARIWQMPCPALNSKLKQLCFHSSHGIWQTHELLTCLCICVCKCLFNLVLSYRF